MPSPLEPDIQEGQRRPAAAETGPGDCDSDWRRRVAEECCAQREYPAGADAADPAPALALVLLGGERTGMQHSVYCGQDRKIGAPPDSG